MSKHEAMLEVAKQLELAQIPYFVIGATARDLLSEHYGIQPSERRTADVDFAILLNNWEVAKYLRLLLLQHPDIKCSEKREDQIRYYYKGVPFDLVPFGGVEKKHVVSWPPHHDTAMCVLGFREALENSIELLIGGQIIKILSVEFFVALKIIAWGINGGRSRDIVDVGYVLENYDKFNKNAYTYILDSNLDLLEAVGADPALASIGALGMHMASKTSVEAKNTMLEILELNDSSRRIIQELMRVELYIDDDSRDLCERKWQSRLSALILGLRSE